MLRHSHASGIAATDIDEDSPLELSPDEQAGIEQHRRRYEALRDAGTQVAAALTPTPLGGAPIGPTAALQHETVPGGWYAMAVLRRGDRLRLVNTDGTGAAALLAWSLHDTSERLNHADTLKIQWSAELRRGRVLFSDMGRVMLSMSEDTCGAHDALMGASTMASTLLQYGSGPFRNGRENFVLAALKMGLSRQDVTSCVTFFAPVSVGGDGIFKWNRTRRRAGDFVELRADMDVRVAVSTAPHPLDPAPSYAPGPIELIRLPGPVAAADDPCRVASSESRRGFAHTEANQ